MTLFNISSNTGSTQGQKASVKKSSEYCNFIATIITTKISNILLK